MAFIPRLTDAGMMNNPYWYSDNYFYQIGYGLPNCTCYALGRWIELFRLDGSQDYPDVSHGNANTWFGHPDDYERGQIAKLGAIACWYSTDDPSGAPGHVGVVEVIHDDGSYTVSNSNYGAEYFITYRIYNNYLGANWEFQGFIYNPHVDGGGSKFNIVLAGNILKRRKDNGKTIFYTR